MESWYSSPPVNPLIVVLASTLPNGLPFSTKKMYDANDGIAPARTQLESGTLKVTSTVGASPTCRSTCRSAPTLARRLAGTVSYFQQAVLVVPSKSKHVTSASTITSETTYSLPSACLNGGIVGSFPRLAKMSAFDLSGPMAPIAFVLSSSITLCHVKKIGENDEDTCGDRAPAAIQWPTLWIVPSISEAYHA